MSLRHALSKVWRPAWPALEPVRLVAANRRLEAKWAESEAQKPPEFSLDGIVGRVRDSWRSRSSFADIGRTDRRWLPYALFYPDNARDLWLAADKRFVASLLHEFQRAPRLLPVTLRQLLLRYPTDLSTFGLLRDGLRESLSQLDLFHLAQWRRRVADFALLAPDGPARFADILFDTTRAPEVVLQEAGLDDELAKGEFVRLAVVSGMTALERQLSGRSPVEHLESRLRPVASRGSLRFQQDAHVVAHAVLRPHVRRQPDAPARVSIQTFLLQTMKDPRFDRGLWQRVEPEAVAVLKRWMVGETLDGFFRLIARDALEHHWKYRQAFWGAYFKKGLIVDAWIVLGEDARRAARTVWSEVPQHAILYGAGDASQSVLLLRLGSLVIAEWSHNGRCRVWLDGARAAPRFHESSYAKTDLRNAPGFEIAHMGSDSYSWQMKLADYIRRETQCDVRQPEYKVR